MSSSSSPPRARGPVTGWRAWRVVTVHGRLRLRSAVFDDLWSPGAAAAAACPRGHRAPDPGCTCGLYAVREPARALRYLVGRDDPGVAHRVLGRVALWGVTVEGEHGWRAELATPTELVVPAGRTSGEAVGARAIAVGLAAVYAVPAEVIAESVPDALVARFSRRPGDPPLSRSAQWSAAPLRRRPSSRA